MAEEDFAQLTALANGRDTLPTNEAARYLSLKDQTLRKWASTGKGPIKPDKINGRNHWSISRLRSLREGGAK